MSESFITSEKFIISHSGTSDLRMLAQVEKWMAAIREISREQQKTPCKCLLPVERDSTDHKINRLRSAFLARSPTCSCT